MSENKFIDWLNKWGIIGTFIGNILLFLTAQWALAVTAVIAYLSVIWGTSFAFIQRPGVQLGAMVFLFLLWTMIGILYLRDRTKPRAVSPSHDLRYGLTFEGIIPMFPVAKTDADAALAFGIQLRNFTSGPIRYAVEVFDVVIDDRMLPKIKKGQLTAVMARGAGRMSRNQAFSREKVKDFIDKDVRRAIELSIAYGHPEKPPERRLKMTFDLKLILREGQPSSFSDNIMSESDEPIV